jgi:hypothetical protein
MAILSHGPLGNFTGPVGNIIGSTWKGKQVIRQKPAERKAVSTELQIQQQIKFSLIMKLLQPLTDLVKQTFSQNPPRMTRFNRAFSQNYRRAVTGTYPDFSIDYSQVILGRGRLSQAGKITCSSPSTGKLSCTWINYSNYANAGKDDKVYLVSYCERLNHWSFEIGITDRDSGFCATEDAALSEESLHIYIGFISAYGKQSSDSQYVGLVSIQ